ncbi:MAG TPA: hypothetical protein VL988_05180 [Solirubrobacteraceae bacterium]|nr:hypothetical protein [Solirubrobacteraceae bacterium]
MLAIQRNRYDMTQWDLGQEIGIEQLSISNVENGKSGGLTDAQVDALFERLDLEDDSVQASFIKWWQGNAV